MNSSFSPARHSSNVRLETIAQVNEETYQTLVAFIEKHYWAPKTGFSKTTTIADDLGIDGQDGAEFMELIAAHFELNMIGFDWLKYFAPEGCNPLIPLLWPLRARMSKWWLEFFQFDLFCEKTPLTLQHICACIDARCWLDVPPDKAEQTETEQDGSSNGG